MSRDPFLTALDDRMSELWRGFFARPEVARIVSSGALADRRALALYLVQAYHITWHTSRNQALVAVNPDNTDLVYMKYCLRHALEEVGHEQLALHDLRALGVRAEDPARDLPPPLPATEQLLAWLYRVSTSGNPVARLGYSWFAERAYPFGGPYLAMVKQGMRLTDAQLTFFTVHQDLDQQHGEDVGEAIRRACGTDADRAAVQRTMEVTMRLTFQGIDELWAEYQRLVAGEPSAYSALADVGP